MKKIISLLFLIFSVNFLFAAPSKDLWSKWLTHNPNNVSTIEHSLWDAFLSKYIDDKHFSEVNLVRYKQVTLEDKKYLKSYLQKLQNTKISLYKRDEQMAFWINLYNSKTFDVILESYPVKTILDIDLSGFLTNGPWDKKFMKVEGEKLSLNDIEHRILRPIWNDNRIHYALNCASIGCPNIVIQAFTSKNLETLLEKGAVDYINHIRGVKFDDEDILASSIFDWYMVDFGDDESKLIKHWIRYASPSLKQKLLNFDGDIDYEYNWSLNEVK